MDRPPNSSSILNTSTETSYKIQSMMYKRRPPTPVRFNKKFELGELDSGNAGTSTSKLNPEVEREEIALKDELLRIFQREKDAMEQHYLNKIQDLLRSFKAKKIEWEEMVKAEREDLEGQFEIERSEIHQNFAQEITKLTRQAQEEHILLERKFDDRSKERDIGFDREKRDLHENFKTQLEVMKKQCQNEYEATINLELKNLRDKHQLDLDSVDQKFENLKYNTERKFERDLADSDSRHHKVCFEMEKKFEDEKLKLDREWQRKIELVELAMKREVERREEVERVAANDKANLQAVNQMLKEEIGRLKEEIERLKKLPIPPPEVKIIEKTKELPPIYYNSRSDLPPHLREDFDRILNEYKESLRDKFQRDKTDLEEKLEAEKQRLRENITRQKEELDKRLAEEKFRMERDLDKSRDDIEKEIERRLRTKQLSDSLAIQQQRFEEVTKRLEEEERNRRNNLRDDERKKYEQFIQDLQRENDGLKAKVTLLEDNNHVLKNLKDEGQQEVDRLRRAVEELKISVDAKRDNDRTCVHTPAEFMMSMMQEREPVSQKSNADDLSIERRKLEDLKHELQKQERDIRERRTVEDAAKMAADKSSEKFENLLSEKRKLEDSLKSLEQRVVSMQDEFLRLRYTSPNQTFSQPPPPPPPQTQPAPQPPVQQIVTQPQPIIVQPSYPPHPPFPPHPPPGPPPSSKEGSTSSPQFSPLMNFPNFYYPQNQQQQPPLFSPNVNDQSDKIFKLKTAKERMTRQLEEFQDELKEANRENNLLQKQCREFERQIEKLGDALERERDISNNLRDMLSDEKIKTTRLTEDLNRETQQVNRLKSEAEDTKLKLQREIQELQAKLHHAGQTLAAVRQQASNDITVGLPPTDATIGMVALPSPMAPMASIMAANAARRRASLKMNGLSASRDSFSAFERVDRAQQEKQEFLAKEELARIRSLEEEKMRLQGQLDDAKGALDAYSGKLDTQLNSLQSKIQESSSRTNELTEENRSLNRAVSALGMEQTNQARQNFHLRQQKMQLQKLIERLTSMNPQPPPY